MILRSYLKSAPPLLNALKDAALSKDIAAMGDPAHTLKSSSANVGAMKLSAMAKLVEQAARTGNLPDPVTPVKQMFAEFKQVGPRYIEMIKSMQ